mgnify:CR=1 FL=1
MQYSSKEKNKDKVIVLVPALTARGGITNYYQVLKSEFGEKVEYFERGARTWPVRKGFIPEIIRAWGDYKRFKNRLKLNDISLVQCNTSLGLNSIIRDGMFLLYARKKGIRTIAFFHGWNPAIEYTINRYYKRLFAHFFFETNQIIIINQRVQDTLRSWGYKGRIHCETTLYDKKICGNINEEYLTRKYETLQRDKKFGLLYLSRLEKEKGIYELFEAFKLIKANNLVDYDIRLTVCGDGYELENIKKKVNKDHIDGVIINGFVDGAQKTEAFEGNHVFVLPSYTEGMPVSVLEAMGFGLPVIATPVGGLNDIIEDGKNGYFVEVRSAKNIIEKILKLTRDPDGMMRMSLNNYEMANKKFRSDIVAKRIKEIHSAVLEE